MACLYTSSSHVVYTTTIKLLTFRCKFDIIPCKGEMNMSKIGTRVLELVEQGYTMEEITNGQVELA